MVTSSVWMLHWILGHTTDFWPAVTLDGILVVGTSCLEHWLVSTSTSGDDADLGTDVGLDGLLSSGWEAETGGSLFFVVGDNNGKGTGAAGESTTVSELGLDVAHDGSLWDNGEWEHVSDGQGGLLSAVDELSRVHTLGTEEELIVALVTVGVQELDLGDWCTTAWIVQDFLDDSADVSMLLSIVQRTELDGALACAGVRLEDGGLTLSLCLLFQLRAVAVNACSNGFV